jgi:hypothetical protein
MSLYSGQGPAFWSPRNASGDPTVYNWFGNASEATVGLATETLTHKESYTGQRNVDARIITEISATLAVTTDDFKESNMELATYGTGSQIATTNVTNETVVDHAPLVGERYALKNTGRVSSVVLTAAGGAITAGTHYTVDASGVIVFLTSVSGPIVASYTNAASRQVGVFKTSAPEIHIRIDGLNTATSVTVSGSSDYERSILDIFKCRLDPTEALNFINDEFGTMVLNGSPLVDETKAASAAGGQFMRIIYLDPPSQTVASASASPSASSSRSVSPSASASPSA